MSQSISAAYCLGGLRVIVTQPRVVAEVSSGRCWYPDILRFSAGELMLNHSLNADTNENAANAQAVYLSFDGGATFAFAYTSTASTMAEASRA